MPWQLDPSKFQVRETGKRFNKAADADRIKVDQELQRRFKTPDAREDALAAFADRDLQREDAENVCSKKVAGLFEGYDFTRPFPPDFAKHLNEERDKAFQAKAAAIKEADRLHEASLTEIETRQFSIAIGPIRENRQIIYQPAEKERSEMSQASDRAASEAADNELQNTRDAEATRQETPPEPTQEFNRAAESPAIVADDGGRTL